MGVVVIVNRLKINKRWRICNALLDVLCPREGPFANTRHEAGESTFWYMRR